MKTLIKNMSMVSLGSGLLALLLCAPNFALTKSITMNGLEYRVVTFNVVNMSNQPFCIQGHSSQAPVCVPAHQSKTDKVSKPIQLVTGYFYQKSGLFHHWRNNNAQDQKKMALVADHSDQVNLRIMPNGDIHYKGINEKTKMDLQTYMKWHGLKGLL